MDDRLLEPLKAYREYYDGEFTKNCAACFDELVTKSGIRVEENRKTVAAYDAACKESAGIEKLLSKQRGRKGLLIAISVIGAILLAIGIACFVMQTNWVVALVLTLCGILPIIGIFLLFKFVRPAIKNLSTTLDKKKEEAEKILKEAWRQMAPLNALYDSDVTVKLIEKTVPLLEIDDNFNMRRYDVLSGKYGLGEPDNPERSTVGILTGEILGNPFVIDRELVHTMGIETYTGSLTISWTTTSTDSEGHVHIETHTQTLYASVHKPRPYYSEQTRLIYGNEAAPELRFSRSAGHAERLSDKERARKVKEGAKEIRKRQDRAMKDDRVNFTEMGNSEFDVLFGALNRNNEVEFRLLFTPLAQKNMLALLTDKSGSGFGDDFTMIKAGMLNYISSEHSAGWDPDLSYRRYLSYSVDIARRNFIQFNRQYFRCLYFDFAPLLSIPLYQQHKPHEYIYREVYPRNYTGYEAEYAANNVGRAAFAPPGSATEVILKTRFLGEEGKSDRVLVHASSYTAQERVEYVSVWGGDGCLHEVPVYWTEYLPVSSEREIRLKELGLTERQFERASASGALSDVLSRHGGEGHGYGHGILCCIGGEESFDGDFSDALEKMKNQNGGNSNE